MYIHLAQLHDFVTLSMLLRALIRCDLYYILSVVKPNASPILLLLTFGVRS
jgi:hypothetical protein